MKDLLTFYKLLYFTMKYTRYMSWYIHTVASFVHYKRDPILTSNIHIEPIQVNFCNESGFYQGCICLVIFCISPEGVQDRDIITTVTEISRNNPGYAYKKSRKNIAPGERADNTGAELDIIMIEDLLDTDESDDDHDDTVIIGSIIQTVL